MMTFLGDGINQWKIDPIFEGCGDRGSGL